MSAVHGFIKPGPSVSGSMTQIKDVKGYPLDLIFTVDHGPDGGLVSSSSPRLSRNKAPGGAMASGLRELKLALWVTKLRSDSSYMI
jgi:hypothetical protein